MNSSRIFLSTISLHCSAHRILRALSSSSVTDEPATIANISSVMGSYANSSNIFPFFDSASRVEVRRSDAASLSLLFLLPEPGPSDLFSSSCVLRWSLSFCSYSISLACLAFTDISSKSDSPFLLCISSIMRQTAFMVEYYCSFSAYIVSIPFVKELINLLKL